MRTAIGQIIVSGATDRGRVRETNEDHFVVAELTRALQIQATSLPQPETLFGGARLRGHLLVVADGMGGHRGGQEASALAVITIEDFLLNTLRWFFKLTGDNVVTEFQLALRAADERIFAAAANRPDLRGMGTTVTMAYAIESTLWVAHVGDSRLYIRRGGQLYQVTNDHTIVGELMRQRLIDQEAANHHPMRHVVTNSVGGDRPGVQPEVHKIELEPGDIGLLCSDGVNGVVPDDEIAEILGSEGDPASACHRLIERANGRGGPDNITAIVAHFLP